MFGFKAAINGRHLMLKDIERAREAAERSQQHAGQIGGYEVRVIDGERVLVVELKSFPTPEQG